MLFNSLCQIIICVSWDLSNWPRPVKKSAEAHFFVSSPIYNNADIYHGTCINFYQQMIMVENKDKKEVLDQLHKKMISEIQDFAIILLDIDGTIISWNIGAEMIKGYKESEIIGQNFRIFYMPGDRQAGLPEQLIDLAKREGRARHIGRRVRKDGTIFWGSILITALHGDDGGVIGFTKLTKEIAPNELPWKTVDSRQ